MREKVKMGKAYENGFNAVVNLKCYNDTSVNNSLQNSSLDLDWPLQFFQFVNIKGGTI